MALMFSMGALTISKMTNTSHYLSIPNMFAKKEYIEVLKNIMQLKESDLSLLSNGIAFLRDKEDPKEYLNALSKTIYSDIQGRDVIVGEDDFSRGFVDGLRLCKPNSDTVQKEIMNIDAIYTAKFEKNTKTFCFTLKNVKSWHLNVIKSKDWNDQIEESIQLLNGMSDKDMRNLIVNWKKSEWICANPSIQNILDGTTKQFKEVYYPKLLASVKENSDIYAWVIVRIGPKYFAFQKIEL